MRLRFRTLSVWLGLVWASVFFAGCQKPQTFKLVQVDGVVKIKGEPAENVLVQFMPDETSGRNCPTSSGISDEEGKFTLATVDGRAGAVVGTCRVTVVDMNQTARPGAPADFEPPPKRKHEIPPKHQVAGPSGLSAEVKEDGEPIIIDIVE